MDRMDEALEFGLPHVDERKKILELYLERRVIGADGLGLHMMRRSGEIMVRI